MNDSKTPSSSTSAVTPALTQSDTIQIALELSLRIWVVGILGPDGRLGCHKVPTMDTGKRMERIDRGDPVRTLVTYEAGFEGFWLARWLQDCSIRVVVNDPTSLELPRRSCVYQLITLDSVIIFTVVFIVSSVDIFSVVGCAFVPAGFHRLIADHIPFQEL